MNEYTLPKSHPFHSAWRGQGNGARKPDDFPPAEGVTAQLNRALERKMREPWRELAPWRPDDMPSKKGAPAKLAKLIAECRREDREFDEMVAQEGREWLAARLAVSAEAEVVAAEAV